jgi:hypothetical protein
MEETAVKIIELVDVVAEPENSVTTESPAEASYSNVLGLTPEMEKKLEEWVRKEVDRIIRSSAQEEIKGQIREILINEIEKALQREIETLKGTGN